MRRIVSSTVARAAPSAPTAAKLSTRWRQLARDGVFLLPALMLFSLVVIYPVFSSLFYGFTDWDGVSPTARFIGLQNFQHLLTDSAFHTAFMNTLIFTVAAALLQNGIALGLALALDYLAGWVKGFAGALRVVFLIPMLLSPLAIGYLGQYMFSPTFGVLDNLLAALHLAGWTHDWLGDPQVALASVIGANLWQYVGYNMIIYLAGLQAVPRELYEAASIDGAASVQQFQHVTWPLLAPATTISLLLTLIGGFKVFDLIFAMTNGGPGYATESIVMRIYREGFQLNHFGYAAAMSITLCLFIFLLSLSLLAILRRREVAA